MAQRVRRRQDDDCTARSADPSLRNHRDRKRELALQAPRLSRCTAPACPGGQTGTSRAALRRTRGGHSAPRGSLLFATGTSLNPRPRGVTIGRRSGVKLQRRLTRSQWRQVADQLRPRVKKLAELMDEAENDVLAYMSFPPVHRPKLHSTNPIERVNGEKIGRA